MLSKSENVFSTGLMLMFLLYTRLKIILLPCMTYLLSSIKVSILVIQVVPDVHISQTYSIPGLQMITSQMSQIFVKYFQTIIGQSADMEDRANSWLYV